MKKAAILYIVGYLAVVVMFAYVIEEMKHDREVELYRLCILGNEFRKDLVVSQRQETEDLIAASQANQAEVEVEENRAAVQSYRARRERSLEPLKPIDCGEKP